MLPILALSAPIPVSILRHSRAPRIVRAARPSIQNVLRVRGAGTTRVEDTIQEDVLAAVEAAFARHAVGDGPCVRAVHAFAAVFGGRLGVLRAGEAVAHDGDHFRFVRCAR